MSDVESNQQQRTQAERDTDPRVDLAVERTELALERTQLAWIRTSLAFLGSGIALDKGLEVMHKARTEAGDALFQNAHVIGISLSVTGTVLMILTTWSYVRRLHSLAGIKGARPSRLPHGALASVIIIVLGLGISFLLLVS